MIEPSASYKRQRDPPSVISYAVWLCFRFPRSLRLLERGIIVFHETNRCWATKFGPDYARRLRRKAPSPNDVWHLDEVVVMIGGQKHWLWRAIDQDGYSTRSSRPAAHQWVRRSRSACLTQTMMLDHKL